MKEYTNIINRKLILSIIMISTINCGESILDDPVDDFSEEFNEIIDCYYSTESSAEAKQEDIELIDRILKNLSIVERKMIVTNYIDLYYKLIIMADGRFNEYFKIFDGKQN